MKRKRGNASRTQRASSENETFGVRLRRYRKRRQYTLAALVYDAETDARTLRHFEWDGGADVVPDMRLGLRLANLLGVHPHRLAFGTYEPLASEHPRTSAALDQYEARAAACDAARAGNVRPIR